MAVRDDDDGSDDRVVRQRGDRIRGLGRPLGRKTLGGEILKEALDEARQGTDAACLGAAQGRFLMKAEALGLARSSLPGRVTGRTEPRRRQRKAQHAAAVPAIPALLARRPIHGCRRITAGLSRQLQAEGPSP